MFSTGRWPLAFATMIGWSSSMIVVPGHWFLRHSEIAAAASVKLAIFGGPSSRNVPSSLRTRPTIAPRFLEVHAESNPIKSKVPGCGLRLSLICLRFIQRRHHRRTAEAVLKETRFFPRPVDEVVGRSYEILNSFVEPSGQITMYSSPSASRYAAVTNFKTCLRSKIDCACWNVRAGSDVKMKMFVSEPTSCPSTSASPSRAINSSSSATMAS